MEFRYRNIDCSQGSSDAMGWQQSYWFDAISPVGAGAGPLHHHPHSTAAAVPLQGAFPELYRMQPAQLHPMPQPRPTYRREDQAPPFGFHAPAPKRPRTILTATQRHLFKSIFEQNPKPCRKVWCSSHGQSAHLSDCWLDYEGQREAFPGYRVERPGSPSMVSKSTS